MGHNLEKYKKVLNFEKGLIVVILSLSKDVSMLGVYLKIPSQSAKTIYRFKHG